LVIPGTSFKGVLRDLSDLSPEQEGGAGGDVQRRWAAFGPSRARASDYRGGLVLSDARLLLLPVPSLKGTFAWATSRFLLRRFNDELADAKLPGLPLPKGEGTCVAPTSKLRLGDGRVSLREVLVSASESAELGEIATKLAAFLWPGDSGGVDLLRQRLAVLPDDIFNAFARSSLEVRARVAIDSDTGTAEASGPWTEEHVPAETVLAGLAFGRKTVYRGGDSQGRNSGVEYAPDSMLKVFTDAVQQGKTIRVGGHSSVGLGRVRLTCARQL
jgi:CRISPR-associated protein Cmr4